MPPGELAIGPTPHFSFPAFQIPASTPVISTFTPWPEFAPSNPPDRHTHHKNFLEKSRGSGHSAGMMPAGYHFRRPYEQILLGKKMRYQMRSTNEFDIWVFSPLFLAATGFAATLRLLEVYLSATTTVSGLVTIWRGAAIGDLGIADFVCLVAFAFVIVAILDVLQCPRMIGRWMTLGFCVLLAVYAATIYHFTEKMIDLGFPVEPWKNFSEQDFDY
jgi:hypothetical protein